MGGSPIEAWLSEEVLKEFPVHYEEALKGNNENSSLYKKLAILHVKNNEPKSSLIVFKEAIKLNPDYAIIYEDIANALRDANQSGIVDDLLELTETSGSQNSSLYYFLGYNYQEQEKNKRAIKCFEKALKINPFLIKAKNSLGYSYYKLGRFSLALNSCKEAIQIDSKNAYAYNLIGMIFFDQGNFENCQKTARVL